MSLNPTPGPCLSVTLLRSAGRGKGEISPRLPIPPLPPALLPTAHCFHCPTAPLPYCPTALLSHQLRRFPGIVPVGPTFQIGAIRFAALRSLFDPAFCELNELLLTLQGAGSGENLGPQKDEVGIQDIAAAIIADCQLIALVMLLLHLITRSGPFFLVCLASERSGSNRRCTARHRSSSARPADRDGNRCCIGCGESDSRRS